ncbi:hypothetical protein C0584_04680 [Candidatus Parcubacteria bacterium]|nr:MAG: hypothetical protein C0584_04680 [Candidatus Parcubacteria bacterium]
MSLKARKILFILFIFAFLVITPLVSLYAAGYKFTLSGEIIQKTGMIVLDSQPEGAKIYINGEPQQRFFDNLRSNILNDTEDRNILKTPARIKGLFPGEYTVTLLKDGYWEWEKKLEVFPGQSTFAEDVVIFKNNLPLPLSSGEILNSQQSSSKEFLAFSTKDKYLVLGEDEQVLFYDKNSENLESQNNYIKWFGNNQILFDNHLFSLDTWSKPVDLSAYLNNINLEFISPIDSKNIYAIKDNQLVKLNLSRGSVESVLKSEKILDYFAKGDFIYTIEELGGDVFLIVYNGTETIRKIDLNKDNSFRFTNKEHELINIYSPRFKTLHLIDPLDYFGPLKETINNVNRSFWVDSNKLVFYNDFEIWIYNRVDFKKNILTRISDKISTVLWHPSNNYIIYSTQESLFTIELDDREKHTTNHLIKLNNIDFLNMSNDGYTLYFYSSLGKKEGLYKLAI